MKIRPSVAIIENGNVLLMRYEYGGQTVYNLPGGNAEHLETLKEGVERELVEELNLVMALSTVVPLFTEPVTKSELVVLCQSRIPLGALLRTMLVMDPVLAILIKAPSTLPTNFLPPSDSLLDPTR